MPSSTLPFPISSRDSFCMLFNLMLTRVPIGRFLGRPAPALLPPQGFFGPMCSALNLSSSHWGFAIVLFPCCVSVRVTILCRILYPMIQQCRLHRLSVKAPWYCFWDTNHPLMDTETPIHLLRSQSSGTPIGALLYWLGGILGFFDHFVDCLVLAIDLFPFAYIDINHSL